MRDEVRWPRAPPRACGCHTLCSSPWTPRPSAVIPAAGKGALMDASVQTEHVSRLGSLKKAKKSAALSATAQSSRFAQAASGEASNRLDQAASGRADSSAIATNYPYAHDDMSVFRAPGSIVRTSGLVLEQIVGPAKPADELFDLNGKSLIELDE